MKLFTNSNQFHKQWTALRILLIGLSIVCLLAAAHQWMNSFNYKNYKQKVKNWRVQQQLETEDFALQRRLSKIKRIESEYSALLKKERELLEKRKQERFNRQEDTERGSHQLIEREVQELTQMMEKHEKEMKKSRDAYNFLEFKYSSEWVRLLQNYHGQEIKGQDIINENLQKIRAELEDYELVLSSKLENGYTWYQTQWQKYQQSALGFFQQETTVSFTAQNFQGSAGYKAMPQLARLVLSPLPVELVELLYGSEVGLPEKREKVIRQRRVQIESHSSMQSIQFAGFNLLSTEQSLEWSARATQEYDRLSTKYDFEQVKKEEGMCVLVPTYQNNIDFRVQLNLNSIFAQNYTNYKVVIIDDASTDHTPHIIRKYLSYYQIGSEKAEIIANKAPKKALENIYKAALDNCQGYPIAVIVDGDDELLGLNVLKTLNAIYSSEKVGVLYSSFYHHSHQEGTFKKGFTSSYSYEDMTKGYRQVAQKFSHLITFRIELLRQVRVEDLMDGRSGKFYGVAYDFAMMYPMMELACSHVKWIDEWQYLYSVGTGMNDFSIHKHEQLQIGKKLLKQTPYPCSPKYQQS